MKNISLPHEWLDSFPGLIWSIEVPRSRLKIFNLWQHPLLGEKTGLLLKDAHFRQQASAPENHPQLAEFWEAIASRSPACAFFRLASHAGQWLVLQGWPCAARKDYYNGILQSAHEYLAPELCDAASGMQGLCRSVAGYPVLLVDLRGKTVAGCNAEAAQFLNINPDEPVDFFSLMPRASVPMAAQALEQLEKNPVWSGSLNMHNASGVAVSNEVRLNAVAWKNRPMARISFLRSGGRGPALVNGEKAAPGTMAQSLLEQAATAPDLRAALEMLLASSQPHAFDALIFSDIQAGKGCVTVYGIGAPCNDLPWGSTFSYEGTIAQDIERHNLKYLVVEDTLDSIKSIDWVLFVPRGIRSYIARPFYQGANLHAVLILCSTRPGAFSPANAAEYEVLAPAFARAISVWRSAS